MMLIYVVTHNNPVRTGRLICREHVRCTAREERAWHIKQLVMLKDFYF